MCSIVFQHVLYEDEQCIESCWKSRERARVCWSNHHRLCLCWVWIGCTCNAPGNWGCGHHCLHGSCDCNWQHAIPCNSAVFDAVGRWNSNDLASWLLTLLSTFVPIHLTICASTYWPVCLSIYLSIISRYLHISTHVPISSQHILVLYVGARWCESKCKVWIRPVLTSVPYPESMPKWSKMQVHTVPYVWTTAERSIPNPWPTPISSPYLLRSIFFYSCNYLIPSYLIPSQPFSS